MRIVLVAGLLASVVLSGCKDKGGGAGSDGAASASASASATAPLAIPGRPAGDVLRQHPELPLTLSSEWEERLAAYVGGDTSEKACPAVGAIKVTDEFERREAVAKATAACKTENDRAVGYLKSCPVVVWVSSTIGTYNFDRHAFPVFGSGGSQARTTAANNVLFDGSILAPWPGMGRDTKSLGGVSPSEMCNAHAPIQDTVDALTGFKLDVPMDEASAKQARETMKEAAEDFGHVQGQVGIKVALLIDGGSTREGLACGVSTPPAMTARVLAWRIAVGGLWGSGVANNVEPSPVTDWTTVTNWDPPPSCADARAFFGPKPDSAKASDPYYLVENDKTCVCALSLDPFKSWVWDLKLVEVSAETLPSLKGRVARGRKRFDSSLFGEFDRRPGCKADGGARAQMAPVIGQARKALAALDDALSKDAPDLAAVSSRLDALNTISNRIDDILDPKKGSHFGCPRP